MTSPGKGPGARIAFIREAIRELQGKGHPRELARIFYHAGEIDTSPSPGSRQAAPYHGHPGPGGTGASSLRWKPSLCGLTPPGTPPGKHPLTPLLRACCMQPVVRNSKEQPIPPLPLALATLPRPPISTIPRPHGPRATSPRAMIPRTTIPRATSPQGSYRVPPAVKFPSAIGGFDWVAGGLFQDF